MNPDDHREEISKSNQINQNRQDLFPGGFFLFFIIRIIYKLRFDYLLLNWLHKKIHIEYEESYYHCNNAVFCCA